MVYVILGMHKSGTTLAAELLQRSGVRMIEPKEEADSHDYDRGNKVENVPFRDLNISMLNWPPRHDLFCEIPTDLSLTDAYREKMEAVVEQHDQLGVDWGFKDPRTCITYPLWKAVLPEHKIIGIYRSPSQVLRHFCRDTPVISHLRVARILRLWYDYNVRILEAIKDNPKNSILIRYEELMENDAELERLQDFVGLEIQDSRKPQNYRNREGSQFFFGIGEKLMFRPQETLPTTVSNELEAICKAQIEDWHASKT